jgi:fumarate reductase flavoprotein subunit
MATIEPARDRQWPVTVDVLVVGAGAAGLITALRATEAGATVLVLERDALPRGSTALSAGLIPAAGTRFQAAAGICDTPAAHAADILAKSGHRADPDAVHAMVNAVGPALEWLSDRHGLPFSVIENFSYPGHSARRMHGLPSRAGSELMDWLSSAADRSAVDVVTEARVTTLFRDAAGGVCGARFQRPDGTQEEVGCRSLVLACNGYGANPALVRQHIPALAGALYFGHPGNQGDAVLWGEELGAAIRDMAGHQGHGSVAHPHGILITWATMTEGGFQVNGLGQRFSDESRGYSEQAMAVLAQRDGLVWSIFDARIAAIARQFVDFQSAEAAGAVLTAPDWSDLAKASGLPRAALEQTAADVRRHAEAGDRDVWGRTWEGQPPLRAPFHAVKVTGALFHTQGGLRIDPWGKVLDRAGHPIPHLYAVGGAACGISGPAADGYLSGNGLLTACALGFVAGHHAAQDALGAQTHP